MGLAGSAGMTGRPMATAGDDAADRHDERRPHRDASTSCAARCRSSDRCTSAATIYREREYVALRLTTADGTEGHAIGYTRGLPLDAMVRPLAARAPRLPREPTARPSSSGCRRRNVNADGAPCGAPSPSSTSRSGTPTRGAPACRCGACSAARARGCRSWPWPATTRGAGRGRGRGRGPGARSTRASGAIKLHTADAGASWPPSAPHAATDAASASTSGMAWRSLPDALEPARRARRARARLHRGPLPARTAGA